MIINFINKTINEFICHDYFIRVLEKNIYQAVNERVLNVNLFLFLNY